MLGCLQTIPALFGYKTLDQVSGRAALSVRRTQEALFNHPPGPAVCPAGLRKIRIRWSSAEYWKHGFSRYMWWHGTGPRPQQRYFFNPLRPLRHHFVDEGNSQRQACRNDHTEELTGEFVKIRHNTNPINLNPTFKTDVSKKVRGTIGS